MPDVSTLIAEAAQAVAQLTRYAVPRPDGTFTSEFAASYKAAMGKVAGALAALNASAPLLNLQNLGGGAGVFRDKLGQIAQLRSLIAGTGIKLTQQDQSILIALEQDLIALTSTQQWQLDAQPPVGTRATPFLPTLPAGFTQAKLKSLTYWNAIAPSGVETLTLRIYKYFGDGSGLVLMTDPIVVNSGFANFVTVDVSSAIRNLFWAPGDILAVSRVYSAVGTLQAPLLSWNFELIASGSPSATPVVDPPVWPAP